MHRKGAGEVEAHATAEKKGKAAASLGVAGSRGRPLLRIHRATGACPRATADATWRSAGWTVCVYGHVLTPTASPPQQQG